LLRADGFFQSLRPYHLITMFSSTYTAAPPRKQRVLFHPNFILMASRKKWVQPGFHILCWIIFLMLPGFFKPDRPDMSFSYLLDDMLSPMRFANGLLVIAVFYINYLYAVPYLWFRDKYMHYAGVFVSCVVLLFAINGYIRPAFRGHKPPPGVEQQAGRFPQPPPHRSNMLGPSHNLFMFLMAFGFSFAAAVYRQYQHTKEEKLNAEISFLKAQINPHFLFNTLNSIYSLTLTKDDHASDAVLHLSSMMRYTTSEADKQTVSLSKELDYIANYINLQRLRLPPRARVDYYVEGKTDGLAIAPLLLIPFVENAFKYGVNAEENSAIAINISVGHDRVTLHVHNRKVRVQLAQEDGTGLGLENTRRRLEMLYPGKHTLTVKDEPADFTIYLRLLLA
jgi:hypothetical protein